MVKPAPRIVYSVVGPTAWITLDRPDKHNAQDMRMLRELDAAVGRAQQDDAIRVVVLNGTGPSFSAGHDLHENAHDPSIARSRATVEGRLTLERRMYVDVSRRVRDLRVPTIASVHGHCIGAGLMLAAMCDLIIASEDATFSNPAVLLGAAGTEILVEPWEVGARRAKEMLFTGAEIGARQAMSWGLVNRVVKREALQDESAAMAEKIARMPPQAIQLIKESINRSLDTMGQRTSWFEHFYIHQLSHATTESSRIMENRKASSTVREWLDEAHSRSGEPSRGQDRWAKTGRSLVKHEVEPDA